MADELDLPGLTGQLANVIRLLEVGFTKTNGRLDVIALQLEQAEQRHDALAKVEGEHHQKVMDIVEEHEKDIQAVKTALAEARAAAAAAAETAAGGARRFATWVAIIVSVLGVVIGNLDKLLPG